MLRVCTPSFLPEPRPLPVAFVQHVEGLGAYRGASVWIGSPSSPPCLGCWPGISDESTKAQIQFVQSVPKMAHSSMATSHTTSVSSIGHSDKSSATKPLSKSEQNAPPTMRRSATIDQRCGPICIRVRRASHERLTKPAPDSKNEGKSSVYSSSKSSISDDVSNCISCNGLLLNRMAP